VTDKLLILRAFSTLNQVRDAKVPELNLLPSFHELVEDLRARLAQPEPEPVACIVKDCENHKHQGRFVGDLCSPCHAFITRNEGKYSQAYRNAQREWQELTDEELRDIFDSCQTEDRGYVAAMVEAKLKEKNT
jgi:seryl-tRNA(Sec) selenium transferase